MSTRAELRRQKKAKEAGEKKWVKEYQRRGIPSIPPTNPPIRAGMTMQEVANYTGMQEAILQQWQREETERIKKALIIEMQERMSKHEEYVTMVNIIASLKAMEGFRYGKAAARWLLDHYSAAVGKVGKDTVRDVLKELKDKWDIEFEFDGNPETITEIMGYNEYDWRFEFCKHRMPAQVFDMIANEARDAETCHMQLAVAWELCEDFKFHKHNQQMLKKFWNGLKDKYTILGETGRSRISWGRKMLKDKYEFEVEYPEHVEKMIKRWNL